MNWKALPCYGVHLRINLYLPICSYTGEKRATRILNDHSLKLKYRTLFKLYNMQYINSNIGSKFGGNTYYNKRVMSKNKNSDDFFFTLLTQFRPLSVGPNRLFFSEFVRLFSIYESHVNIPIFIKKLELLPNH